MGTPERRPKAEVMTPPDGGVLFDAPRNNLERQRLRKEAREYIHSPEAWHTQVTEIKDVPGISFAITTAIGPQKGVGGNRIATAEALANNYKKNLISGKRDYMTLMTDRPGIPDDERAKSGVVESVGLAIDMVYKHAIQIATMKHGLDNNIYPEELRPVLEKLIKASQLTGGKSVIVREGPQPQGPERKTLFKQFSDHIKKFNKERRDKNEGEHVTAPDMGTGVDDMTMLYGLDTQVASMSERYGGSESPSPVTALGVFHGMRAMLDFKERDGNQTTFAIQGGAGEVAETLIELVRDAYPQADIVISDMPEKLEKAKELEMRYGVRIVEGDEIFQQGGMFVPSGPSEQLTDEHLALLTNQEGNGKRTDMIVGPANYLYPIGQEKEMSDKYHEAGILIGPAPLVNQGGIRKISAVEMMQDMGEERLTQEQIDTCIGDVESMLKHVLERARDENKTPDDIFKEIALDEIADMLVASGTIR